MNRKAIERIFSTDRLDPYIKRHNGDLDGAVEHYKANIRISEAFYPLIATIEVGLRNNIDFQLTNRFNSKNWFDQPQFINIISSFQIDRIADARKTI